ncbi:MAG: cation diffusion facilitator family transporter [Myxococcota bacterium]|nr:cation diffusion facilitator family transporter [Myxococcota bacterium]
MQTHMVIGTPERDMPHMKPADARERSRAAMIAVGVAALLVLLKAVTAFFTGSLAVVTSLVDSSMDCITSAMNFIALRSAEAPPDHDHRWGHGKAESLSSLGQALLLGGSAGVVVWQAIERLLSPAPIVHTGLGVAVMAVSLTVSLVLGWFLRREARQHGSIALEADAAHYVSDGLTNSAAIVALLAYRFFAWSWVDPVISFAAATVLALQAGRIGKRALDELMDRELQDDTRKRIRALVQQSVPQVFGLHALKTRRSGRTLVIEFHLELPAQMSFADAHLVTAQIEETLRGDFPDCMVTIHPEPYIAPGSPLLAGDP